MDLPKIKDLRDLQAILDLMSKNELAELEIEQEGARIRLRKTEPHVGGDRVVYASLPSAAAPVAAGVAPAASPDAAPPGADSDLHVVDSPLVGTFYRSQSPEADPFVQEGDRVEPDTVLCIIEAMKVMNEIQAGASGVVKEILVQNAEPVEFGQPLFRIDTE